MSDDLRDAYASIYNKPEEVDEDFGIISIPATRAAIGTAAKFWVVLVLRPKGAIATAAKAVVLR